MARPPKPYRRLPGKGRHLTGISRLWMARDHLLLSERSFVAENYRRFFFRDIQALLIYKTVAGMLMNAVLAVLLGLCLLAVWKDAGGMRLFFGILGGIWALGLAANLIMGPTCSSYLLTAVQTERLLPLSRLRTARKVLGRLTPEIEAVQGRLDTDGLDPVSEPVRSRASRSGRRPPTIPDRPPGRPLSHWLLFGILLADGLASAAEYFFNHLALTLTGNLIFVGTAVCAVIALVRQGGTGLPTVVKALTWSAAGYLLATLAMGYVLVFSLMVKQPGVVRSQWEMLRALAALSPADSTLLAIVLIFSVVCSLGIGTAGGMSLWLWRRDHRH